MEEDDGGLYDDVEDVKAASAATVKASASAASTEISRRSLALPHDRPKSLLDQVMDLEATVRRLELENDSLKRNMGTLFRTATAELARRDRQLQELRRELETATVAGQQNQQG